MALLVGVGLAIAVAFFARIVGLDRGRSFYPTVMIVVACFYGLFAAISGSAVALVEEGFGIVGFVALALVGFRSSLWWVVAALAGHGVYDVFHGHMITNPGVPVWWPHFCGAYDITAAAILAWLLQSRRAKAGVGRPPGGDGVRSDSSSPGP